MNILAIVIVAILSYSCNSSSLNYYQQQQLNTELEFVQLIFRNGERRPRLDESYPLDPYISVIPYDGRLTDLGHYRARRLGLALRRDYFKLLQDGLYTYSSSLDSCKESLHEVIQTLCAHGECDRTKKSITPKIDVILNSRTCSRYEEIMDKLKRSNEAKKILAQYDGLFRYITEKTGLTLDTASTAKRLHQLYSLLESQRSMNLTLPDWCPEGVYGLLHDMSYVHYNFESQNVDLRLLNGGPLIRRFLDTMSSVKPSARIHLYSGEGRNVAALGRALGKRFPRVPHYGSAIILEKRREVGATNKVFVRTIIWTGVSEKMFPIQLRGCSEFCPLQEFTKIVAETIPSDMELRCLLDDLKHGNRSLF